MDFKTILKEQFKDLITEDTLTAVHEAFEKAVTEKAQLETEKALTQLDEEHTQKLSQLMEVIKENQEKAELEAKLALVKMDEDHSAKLSQLVESIDEDHSEKLSKLIEAIDFDHTQKLNQVLAKIDEDHTAKLEAVVEKYETALHEEAQSFQERLVEEVSNYMDLYLEKTVPTTQVSEAVENIRAATLLQQIRQIVGINEDFVNEEIKEALVDGKKTIDSLKKELNEALETNTELNHKFNQVQSALLLEQKTKDMPQATKNYVTRLLKGKSPEYILENYQYVVEMFDKEVSDQEENAQENVQRRLVEAVDVPSSESDLEEEISVTPPVVKEGVGGYLNEMKKLDKNRI